MVGYQLLDDGTPLSLGAILLSAAALFIGTGYITLDTAFQYTGHFDPSLVDPNRNIGLYVLYQLAPLVFLFLFFILETVLVIRVLGEKKPMRKNSPCPHKVCPVTNITASILTGSCPPLRYRSNISVYR